jgi:Uma2 family endonuclease
MPTAAHQNMAFFLLTVLRAFITPRRLGFALPAPFRVRLGQDRFREPDVCFTLRENSARMSNEFWKGADLVMEVVSPDPKDRDRDLQTKRDEYAKAGVAEYWVVDPQMQRVTVLRLMGGKYKVHVEGKPGGRVGSALLKGFKLTVDEIFAAAEFPD